jgi:hypothetical protein
VISFKIKSKRKFVHSHARHDGLPINRLGKVTKTSLITRNLQCRIQLKFFAPVTIVTFQPCEEEHIYQCGAMLIYGLKLILSRREIQCGRALVLIAAPLYTPTSCGELGLVTYCSSTYLIIRAGFVPNDEKNLYNSMVDVGSNPTASTI